jgi:hypothetical protein
MYHVIRCLMDDLQRAGSANIVHVHDATQDLPLSAPVRDRIDTLKNAIAGMIDQTTVHTTFDTKCQVCFELYDNRERTAIVLGCGHTLCLSCLDKLQKLECPNRCGKITHVCKLYM